MSSSQVDWKMFSILLTECILWLARVDLWVCSHCVCCAVGRGAFAPGDAESQPLVVSDQTGGEPLLRPAGSRLHVEGDATAPSLPREVVVLWPQWRGGDCVLWLHHTLPEH